MRLTDAPSGSFPVIHLHLLDLAVELERRLFMVFETNRRPEVRVVEGLEKDAIALARDRTSLASFRVKLALDRTTLAWIRTTLTMATFGFGLVAFFRALRGAHPQSAEVARMHEGAIEMGMALRLLGIVATGLAGASHWYALRRLRRGEMPVLTHWPLSITVAVLLTGIGLAGVYSLLMPCAEAMRSRDRRLRAHGGRLGV